MFFARRRSHPIASRSVTRKRIAGLLVGLTLLSAWMPPPAAEAAPQVTTQVWVTGYVDRGYTASGVYTHIGSCAVDPRVIPLGTYIVIEGLGTCHAEDTGSAVIGYHIDIWVTTVAEAYAITGYRTATWTPASRQVLGFQAGNPASAPSRASPTPARTSSRAAPSPAPLYVTWTPVAGMTTATPVPAPTTTPVPTTVPAPTQVATLTQGARPTPERVRATSTPTRFSEQPYATWTPSPHAPVVYATWTPVPRTRTAIAYATWTPTAAPDLAAPTRAVPATPSTGSSCKTIHGTRKVHGLRYSYYRTTCR